jgi:hypothetical protein
MSTITERVRYFEGMARLCERANALVLMRAYLFWASCPESCLWGGDVGTREPRRVPVETSK